MTPSPYAGREVTHPPDWHGLVVWDFLFNAVTTGLFLVAAVCDPLRPDLFGPAVRIAYPVALAVLLADLVFLVLDLGHPARFHHMLRVFKPSSPMSLGTWALTFYSLPLTAAAAASVLGWDDVRRLAAGVGLLPAVGACIYKGVLFSTSSQPGWRDARWLGAYHTASAVALGAVGLLVLAPAGGAAELRGAVAVTAVLAMVAGGLLLMDDLDKAVRRRYPPWVRAALLWGNTTGMLTAWLMTRHRPWADVAALAVTAGTAFFVRRVVVLLPQAPH